MPHDPHADTPDVAGALGAPVRQTTPRAEPAPAADDKGPPRSPVDPGSMHRGEDDRDARRHSRDFADDVPPPEHDA